MMARKCIEKYLETHKSTYIGRYRCHSAVQTKKFEHKFHYYILDIQFKAIDVFVTKMFIGGVVPGVITGLVCMLAWYFMNKNKNTL